jgi:hypothetical protein
MQTSEGPAATRSPALSEGGPLGVAAGSAARAMWSEAGSLPPTAGTVSHPIGSSSKAGGERSPAEGWGSRTVWGTGGGSEEAGARLIRLVRLQQTARADRGGAGDHTLSAVSLAHPPRQRHASVPCGREARPRSQLEQPSPKAARKSTVLE